MDDAQLHDRLNALGARIKFIEDMAGLNGSKAAKAAQSSIEARVAAANEADDRAEEEAQAAAEAKAKAEADAAEAQEKANAEAKAKAEADLAAAAGEQNKV